MPVKPPAVPCSRSRSRSRSRGHGRSRSRSCNASWCSSRHCTRSYSYSGTCVDPAYRGTVLARARATCRCTKAGSHRGRTSSGRCKRKCCANSTSNCNSDGSSNSCSGRRWTTSEGRQPQPPRQQHVRAQRPSVLQAALRRHLESHLTPDALALSGSRSDSRSGALRKSTCVLRSFRKKRGEGEVNER